MVALLPTLKVPPSAAADAVRTSCKCTVKGADNDWPEYVAVSVVWPPDFATKRPTPSDVATLGALDVHTAVRPTFTEFALSKQTTVSPARTVGVLHSRVSPNADEGALGPVGVPLPHAVAIDSATLSATLRLLAMTAHDTNPVARAPNGLSRRWCDDQTLLVTRASSAIRNE